MEDFCTEFPEDENGRTAEINVQMTALGIEGAVINILKDGEVVAVAKAKDLEEPSSLSALYKDSENSTYSVSITSTNDAVIPAKSLQIAIKYYSNFSTTSEAPMGC